MDGQNSRQEVMKQAIEKLMEEATQTLLQPLSDAIKAHEEASDRLNEVNKAYDLALRKDEKARTHAAVALENASRASLKVDLAQDEEIAAVKEASDARQKAHQARREAEDAAEVVENHMVLVSTAVKGISKAQDEFCERVADLIRVLGKSEESIEVQMSLLKSVYLS